MRKFILSFLLCLFTAAFAWAQQNSVTGRVTNSTGIPVPGVSVILKGTSNGTTTDGNGNFRITAKMGDILEFSSVGYATRLVTITQNKLAITLAETNQNMSEVVVVGYGTQKKSTLTGSVSQLKGDKLLEAPAMNLTNMITGRVPGVSGLQQSGRPGYDNASLYIRGISSPVNNSPIVIVDGVQRDFANLDPNEIESISVLKDAAAAATYGVQGNAGVILITTKKGVSKKTTISYSGEVTFTQFTRFPKFLNGPDYMKWFLRGEQLDSEYNAHVGAAPIQYTYTQQEIDALTNGTNTNPFFANTDWVGKLTGRTSLTQHHSLSVTGGSEGTRYFINLGYLNQDGVVPNNNFIRYNLRSNIETNLGQYFTVGINIGTRKEDRNSSGIPADNNTSMNPFFQAVRMQPNLPEFTPDGIPTASLIPGGAVNPIQVIDNSGYQKYETNVYNTTLNLSLRVPQVKGLELKLLSGYDKSLQTNKNWTQPYTLQYRNLTTNGWVWVNTNPSGLTSTALRQGTSDYTRTTLQPTITYENKFGKHSVKGLAVYEYSQTDSKSFSTGIKNFFLNDLQEIDLGSPAPTDIIAPTGTSAQTKRAGYVGRINYDFSGKYLLELVGRYDGSMNFYGSSKRWGFFPAASAGWVVSEESFFKNLNTPVNFFKIRGSYGKLGNDRIGYNFPYLQTYQVATNPVAVIGGNAVSGLYSPSVPNPDLTWEVASTADVGFNLGLWKNMFTVEFDWFYKVNRNILNTQFGLYPPSVGGYYPTVVNSGVVDNRGFDLQLVHNNKFGKLYLTATGNVNWAHNRYIKWTEAANTPYAQRLVGKSIGTKFGFQSAGLFQSWDEVNNWALSPSGGAAPGFIKYVDINGDGRITQADDFTVIGRANLPELTYGLDLKLRYGIVDFSLFFQGAAMSDVALGGMYEGSGGTSGITDNSPFTRAFYNYGNSPYFVVENAWTPENPNAQFPRLSSYRAAFPNHNGWQNSSYIRDASYVRLKSAQIGFVLPKTLMDKLHLTQARLYVTGFNLFTWDKLKYLDPEMPNVNNGFYPQQKMYTVGVNLTF